MNTKQKLEVRIREIRRLVGRIDDPALEGSLADELASCLEQLKVAPNEEPVGPFSGLTRSELAASRTCETDWF